ncbi:MAG TPA: radical SAM protein [Eubacteriaceae bacterium]|nr:radical SAM protein [Eubacteriaceae bacterium]
MKTKIIPIFIPHEGCPHDCSFCNQKKIASRQHSPEPAEIQRVIDRFVFDLKNAKNRFEIAFYGGSFTAIPPAKQEEYLSLALENKNQKKLHKIRLSTRPDYMKADQVRLLKKYGVDHVELGVQSTDPTVLRQANRHYDYFDVEQAVENCKQYGLSYGFQIMAGLPGDRRDRFLKTCWELTTLKPKTMRIYPTLVIEDTDLYRWYREGVYKPLSLSEAVYQTALAYMIFTSRSIEVIRMGLHGSKDFLDHGFLAGPFHPAFGELVSGEVYYQLVRTNIKKIGQTNDPIVLNVGRSVFPKIIGQKRSNIERLENELKRKIVVKQNDRLDQEVLLEWGTVRKQIAWKEFLKEQAQGLKKQYHDEAMR